MHPKGRGEVRRQDRIDSTMDVFKARCVAKVQKDFDGVSSSRRDKPTGIPNLISVEISDANTTQRRLPDSRGCSLIMERDSLTYSTSACHLSFRVALC